MLKNSLFAVLLRSPWWYSVLIGVFFVLISAAIANGQYIILGVFTSLPFFGIATYSGYKQAQLPSQKRVIEVAEQVQKMRPIQIAEKIAEPYVEARFDSEAFKGQAANLMLVRGNRTILVNTKRFKAANTGIDPLEKMVAEGEKAEATEYLFVALGVISDAARKYASQNDISILQAPELALYFDGKADIS